MGHYRKLDNILKGRAVLLYACVHYFCSALWLVHLESVYLFSFSSISLISFFKIWVTFLFSLEASATSKRNLIRSKVGKLFVFVKLVLWSTGSILSLPIKCQLLSAVSTHLWLLLTSTVLLCGSLHSTLSQTRPTPALKTFVVDFAYQAIHPHSAAASSLLLWSLMYVLNCMFEISSLTKHCTLASSPTSPVYCGTPTDFFPYLNHNKIR